MRAAVMLVSILAFVALSPSAEAQAEPGTVVGSGHIVAGVFGARPLMTAIFNPFFPPPMPFEFRLAVAGFNGDWIQADVVDHAGAGYFVEMDFFDGTTHVEATCQFTEDSHALMEDPIGTAELRQRCLVPGGADVVFVYAHTGVDLDVTLVVVQPPVRPDPSALIVTNVLVPTGLFTQAVNSVFGSTPGTGVDVTHLVGETLVIDAVDNSGSGYDLQLWFRDAEGATLDAGCAWDESSSDPLQEPVGIMARKQTCTVPEGVLDVALVAYHGVDVDVTVRVV